MSQPLNKNLAGFIAIGALVAGAGQYFIGSPAAAARAQAQAQATQARASIATMPQSVHTLDPDTEMQALRAALDEARTLGRSARDAEALLSRLHRIADDSGVRLESIRPSAPVQLKRADRAPLPPADPSLPPAPPEPIDWSLACELAIRGDYTGIVEFIGHLNDLGWHRVAHIRISPTGALPPDALEASIGLRLFEFELPTLHQEPLP